MASVNDTKKNDIRIAAENDLETFIRVVAPQRVLGHIHQELLQWMERSDAKDHQLVLLPRGHQKSMMIAYRVAWEITRNPTVTVLYISASSGLAIKQLNAIKSILTSTRYTKFWPEMVKKNKHDREMWNTSEICVDHPLRKKEGIRDSTIFTAGLTTNITGLHCDIAVLDDVVTKENAYTADGRNKVASQYSLLSSIENPESREWIVGTRYDPRDLYQMILEMREDIYDDEDEEGDSIGTEEVFEVFERKVEDAGDGAGEFLWPRQQRSDGKYFGFDRKVLAKKRAKYLDKTQYRAQYYNDPNDPENARIKSSKFQYYDRNNLSQANGHWYYRDKKLNIIAAIDFAFSVRKQADYTAIVVVGMSGEGNYYVLGIRRFKSESIKGYFDEILEMHTYWGFTKLRAEVNVAQATIVNELKSSYIKPLGLSLSIEDHRPTRNEGDKAERIAAILEPRYDNLSIWHYRGGECQTLEEELVMVKPPHDDVKDTLASAIEKLIPPTFGQFRNQKRKSNVIFHSRFGGVHGRQGNDQ